MNSKFWFLLLQIKMVPRQYRSHPASLELKNPHNKNTHHISGTNRNPQPHSIRRPHAHKPHNPLHHDDAHHFSSIHPFQVLEIHECSEDSEAHGVVHGCCTKELGISHGDVVSRTLACEDEGRDEFRSVGTERCDDERYVERRNRNVGFVSGVRQCR